MENTNLLETSRTTSNCSRCLNPRCRGKHIYNCALIENPKWIDNWVKNMYRTNKQKPKYESEYAKWENQINK